VVSRYGIETASTGVSSSATADRNARADSPDSDATSGSVAGWSRRKNSEVR
jgi:hypothetical protein